MPAAEPILFPDTSAAVARLLRDAIPDLLTSAKVPDESVWPPGGSGLTEFVVVERTGGISRDVVVDDAQITVDTYAAKGDRAHDLAQLVRAHLNAAKGATVNGTQIYQVNEISGPGWVPTTTGQPRYRQSFIVGARGTAIDIDPPNA